jgi:PAS domain S-box-containing protein
MADSMSTVDWMGRRAVVAFPDRVDKRLATTMGEQFREILNRGARLVIADMSDTIRCDPDCAEMLIHIYQKALIDQAELRLVVSTAAVAQLVRAAGLDRLVSVFPSLRAATSDDQREAASPVAPAGQAPQPLEDAAASSDDRARQPQASAAVLRALIDALDDGILLADADGVMVLANRRLAAMFGYADGELAGQPVEVLVPAGVRDLHREQRVEYGQDPVARPMADRNRLAGVGKDGATRPVTITLSPVPTASGHLILAVVRDATTAARRDDLASLAWAVADEHEHQADTLYDRVIRALFHVGLSLQAAADQPSDVARGRISDALIRLDQVIHDIRDHVFRAQRGNDRP